MMRISSSPNRPFSPQWGLSAATPMRGSHARRAQRAVRARMAVVMRSGVIRSSACAQRDVRGHAEGVNSLITFISPKKPLWSVSFANI